MGDRGDRLLICDPYVTVMGTSSGYHAEVTMRGRVLMSMSAQTYHQLLHKLTICVYGRARRRYHE